MFAFASYVVKFFGHAGVHNPVVDACYAYNVNLQLQILAVSKLEHLENLKAQTESTRPSSPSALQPCSPSTSYEQAREAHAPSCSHQIATEKPRIV